MVNISICSEYNNTIGPITHTDHSFTNSCIFCFFYFSHFIIQSLVQPVQEFWRKVCQNQRASCGARLEILNQNLNNRKSTCSQEGLGGFERHRLEVIHAGFGTGDDHGELPADLVDRQRVVGSDLGCVSNNIEVWHAGFDHDDVSTLVNVPSLRWRLSVMDRNTVERTHNGSTSEPLSTGRKLVALSVTEGRGTPSGFALTTHQALNSNRDRRGTYRNGPYKLLANLAE